MEGPHVSLFSWEVAYGGKSRLLLARQKLPAKQISQGGRKTLNSGVKPSNVRPHMTEHGLWRVFFLTATSTTTILCPHFTLHFFNKLCSVITFIKKKHAMLSPLIAKICWLLVWFAYLSIFPSSVNVEYISYRTKADYSWRVAFLISNCDFFFIGNYTKCEGSLIAWSHC